MISVSQVLPRLRTNLDFMPSPVPDRPGLLIRDPLRYSDVTVIIPQPLVPCLAMFDGQTTDLDFRQLLVQMTGDLRIGDLMTRLIESLSTSGFLEDETFARLRETRHRNFAESSRREAAHAGSAYPDELEPLRETIREYMDGAGRSLDIETSLSGIAAPHVSPQGGWRCYQSAYGALGPQYKECTFVILGTSHYGMPERFGLTRKSFRTPLGDTAVDLRLVDWLAEHAPAAIEMEDYCHSVEHSIEFQVLFLQHRYGPDIRILPILCGSYAHSIYRGGKPEENENVHRFLEVLGELAAREGRRLFWILGIDMAHMGRRYGDEFMARAGEDHMAEVGIRDRRRIECVNAGDADGFWAQVQENRDDLKWCGSSPLYTFLKAVPASRGNLLRYEQWNIDADSVVSFAGLSFAPVS